MTNRQIYISLQDGKMSECDFQKIRDDFNSFIDMATSYLPPEKIIFALSSEITLYALTVAPNHLTACQTVLVGVNDGIDHFREHSKSNEDA